MFVKGAVESQYRDLFFANPRPLLVDQRASGDPLVNLAVYREFRTEAGQVDLFLVWRGGAIVVEFKRYVADDLTLAQALRYTGAIESEYGFRPAILIIAPIITAKLRYAANGCGAASCAEIKLDGSLKYRFAGDELPPQKGSKSFLDVHRCYDPHTAQLIEGYS